MKNNNILFVLVGDGEKFAEIEHIVNEEQLPIKMLGRRNDIPVLMSSFDVLVLPSLQGEGFPVTLVEAQATGCPCIASEFITKEADLGMGLMDFIPLQDANQWILQLNNPAKRLKRADALKYVNELGWDKKMTSNDWMELYVGG